jgi:cold shock protein
MMATGTHADDAQAEADAAVETQECERILAMDEAELDRELQAMQLDASAVLREVEEIVRAAANRGPDAVAAEAAPRQGGDVFEIAGAIKWFDASKGFGFIVPDSGHADVLLHVTCLRASGYQTALPGARVHVQVVARPRGLQALRILGMDESTAMHPSSLPPRTHVVVQPESDWERATVKWYNRVLGFGFLTRGEGTADIFVHAETMRRFGFTELRPNQVLEARWGMGEKGCMAAELRPLGEQGRLPPKH